MPKKLKYKLDQCPNCGRLVHLYGGKTQGILCLCGEELHVNSTGKLIVTEEGKRIYRPGKNWTNWNERR